MKLIFAVLQAKDVEGCADALSAQGFIYTRFPTQGGFLDVSNSTLMIAVGEDEVDGVLDVLRHRVRHRSEMMAATASGAGEPTPTVAPPIDVEVGGATVFVVSLERLEKI